MSHYITATIGNEVIEFTYGTNHRTISAIAQSGFDIYEFYNAIGYNNGMSGTGDSVFVNHEIAKNAYKQAIAWALALRQNYPDSFNKELEEASIHNKEFHKLVTNKTFNKEELNRLINDKLERHDFLSEDEVERSFSLLFPILAFSNSIYEGAKIGNEIEISFC